MANRQLRVILSGGGTGGHIYPAVATAQALERALGRGVEILFVGALGKMEMTKVPALGYNIKGLPVVGLQRKLSLGNLKLPFKIIKSVYGAQAIIKDFKADIVVGFGGYASGPVLWAAQRLGIPTVLQEQNSYAGLTNKLLARKAKAICVAYQNMDTFFDANKIIYTGNPLRGSFGEESGLRSEALDYFGFSDSKPVVMIVGGSLGSRTLNDTMKAAYEGLAKRDDIQVIWQTGGYYDKEMENFVRERGGDCDTIWRKAFIERMDYAYAASDLVVSRSGACTISELCLVGKPTIFVPSPNVAEDHQTKNAMALKSEGAAEIVADSTCVENLWGVVEKLLTDKERLSAMSKAITSLGISDSADRIVNKILEIVE
ncbi:MAG: undecaprenyldiphospho-muramoylpentapeptide beta-N-acetylglucosaminyltransferase [Rikenellaceae bacterium]